MYTFIKTPKCSVSPCPLSQAGHTPRPSQKCGTPLWISYDDNMNLIFFYDIVLNFTSIEVCSTYCYFNRSLSNRNDRTDSYWSKIKWYVLQVDGIHDERFDSLLYETYIKVLLLK